MSDRDLAVRTYERLLLLDERLKALEQSATATAGRLSVHDQEFRELHRDIAELKQSLTSRGLEVDERLRQVATKAREAYDMADELRESLLIDSASGTRVPLREVFVVEVGKLRALQQRASLLLGAAVLLWPFAAEAIKRWLWP